MAQFKDSTGRTWRFRIQNFAAVTRLRTETGLDLNKIGTDANSIADVLAGDAEKLLGAVWTLVEGKKPEDTFDAFMEAIDSEALEAVRRAIIEATFDFFHSGRAEGMKTRLAEILKSLEALSGSNN